LYNVLILIPPPNGGAEGRDYYANPILRVMNGREEGG